ncbi:hypothetical protein FRC03_010499 [Tulasnella sp. 419]|nr:hypothetical protein FRC02_008347 [Tulasnella sp. 418]KAG8957147.1 hypothetical protein FRC03_010499 [Tulasnella sp. 419]
MVQVANAAMRSSEWHDAQGILTLGSAGDPSQVDDSKALKGIMMRALSEAYQRNPDLKMFRKLIQSYINVQYNALLDFASYRNVYGVDWRGPYGGPYARGQMAALETLVAAIVVNDV